jgi:hypothetical protein|tara:strand:- start:303 stop:686 length:384 start_codon:yes stop_codon:yes gene_type:complete
MIATKISEIITWKYPDAKYMYQGDGVQLAAHQNGDDACSGLNWLDEDIDEPSQADVDGWRADAIESYKWDRIRAQRDQLLRDTDYIVLADYEVDDEDGWLLYRQELRDMPQDYPSADDVVWPDVPSE